MNPPARSRKTPDPPVRPCLVEDPELWFAESPHQLEVAKALCRTCAVADACLAGALHRREPWGVWGGEIVHRGRVLPVKRPRGRPRQHASIGRRTIAGVDGVERG